MSPLGIRKAKQSGQEMEHEQNTKLSSTKWNQIQPNAPNRTVPEDTNSRNLLIFSLVVCDGKAKKTSVNFNLRCQEIVWSTFWAVHYLLEVQKKNLSVTKFNHGQNMLKKTWNLKKIIGISSKLMFDSALLYVQELEPMSRQKESSPIMLTKYLGKFSWVAKTLLME